MNWHLMNQNLEPEVKTWEEVKAEFLEAQKPFTLSAREWEEMTGHDAVYMSPEQIKEKYEQYDVTLDLRTQERTLTWIPPLELARRKNRGK